MYRKLSRPTLAVLLAVTLVGSVVIGGGVVAQHSPVDQAQEAPTQETTYLRVMHAAPDAPMVDVYINETMPSNGSVDNESAMANVTVDNESTLTNVTLTNVSFSNISEYMALEAGSYNITITAAGNAEDVIFEDNVTLEPRTVTTLVASAAMMDENTTETPTDENTSTQSGLVMLDDNALRPTANHSAIRVVHLSPDAPTVDVTTANGTVLADGLSYQESSGYMTVPAGDYELQIRIDTPDQNGSVVMTVNVSLEERTAYSAMALGYMNATGEQAPFAVGLTEDASQTIHLPSEAENETATA